MARLFEPLFRNDFREPYAYALPHGVALCLYARFLLVRQL